MKKGFVSAVVFLCFLSAVWAVPVTARLDSMGLSGVAQNGAETSFFQNPAEIYFYDQRHSFSIETGITDSFSTGGGNLFPALPGGKLRAVFAARRIAFSAGIVSYVENETVRDALRYYDVIQTADLDVGIAVGWYGFGLGLGVNVGSSWKRQQVPVYNDSRIRDFVLQGMLEKFNRVSGSEYINVRLGAGYNYGDFTLGLLFPQVLAYRDSRTVFSFRDIIDRSSIGLYWQQDRYGRRGSLKQWIMSAGLEFTSIFSNEDRGVNFGWEGTLQLSSAYNISFRTGFSGKLADFGGGTETFGLGARLGKFDISLYAGIPVSVYSGNSKDRCSLEFAVSVIF